MLGIMWSLHHFTTILMAILMTILALPCEMLIPRSLLLYLNCSMADRFFPSFMSCDHSIKWFDKLHMRVILFASLLQFRILKQGTKLIC